MGNRSFSLRRQDDEENQRSSSDAKEQNIARLKRSEEVLNRWNIPSPNDRGQPQGEVDDKQMLAGSGDDRFLRC